MDRVHQIGGVLLDADVHRQDLVAGAVEEEGVGLADLLRQEEDAPRRAHDGIDDVGIGHEHVARIGIELDDGRLVERQRDALGLARARRRP